MLSISNFSGQNSGTGSQKKLVLGVFTAVFIALLLILLNSFGNNKNNGTEQYFDPGSGETISDPEGKTPEAFSSTGGVVVYLGFSKLLNKGVSQFQIEAIKTAFLNFSGTLQTPTKEISIDTSTIQRTPFDSSDETKELTFMITLDRTTFYSVNFVYTNFRNAKIILSSNGGIIFDSGFIEPKSINPNNELEVDPALD